MAQQTLSRTIEGAHLTKHYLSHTYVGKRPRVEVFDAATKAYGFEGNNLIEYVATNNLLRVYFDDLADFTLNEVVSLSGNLGLEDSNSQTITGQNLRIAEIVERMTHDPISTSVQVAYLCRSQISRYHMKLAATFLFYTNHLKVWKPSLKEVTPLMRVQK